MIDFVITWVDPSDIKWQKSLGKHSKDAYITSARYRDFETLKYVFRGIAKFAPWVNKVHLVTAGHTPSWLNTECKKLKLHTHEDIFLHKNHLPVFSSNAIEVNFLGIPDLADTFVLFNDDMLISKPVWKEDFFINGLPCDFLIQNPIKEILWRLFFSKNIWVQNIKNSIRLISKNFNKKESFKKNYASYINPAYGYKNNIKNYISNLSNNYIYFEHYHHPQPYLKKTWQEVFEIYKNNIISTSSHKFRQKDDITHYLFRYFHLVSGNFHPTLKKDVAYFSVSSLSEMEKCVQLIGRKKFICINDVPELSNDEFAKAKKVMLTELNTFFPGKSIYEI